MAPKDAMGRKDLAATRVRFGYRQLPGLLRREGWAVPAIRVYRIYRQEKFMVPTNNGLTFRVETPATFRMDRPTGSLNPSGMDFLMAIQAERFVRMAGSAALLGPHVLHGATFFMAAHAGLGAGVHGGDRNELPGHLLIQQHGALAGHRCRQDPAAFVPLSGIECEGIRFFAQLTSLSLP